MEPVTASEAGQQIDSKAPSSAASGPLHISPFPHPTNATKPTKKPRSRRKAAEAEEDDDDAKRRCRKIEQEAQTSHTDLAQVLALHV